MAPASRTLGLLLLALLAPVLRADSWFTGDMSLYEPGRGTLLFPLEKPGRYAPARGLETEVEIQVTGVLARTRVRQKFHNQSPLFQEGIYVFPLPPRAAVDTLRVEIGDRVIVGEIQAREAARATYQAARDQGKKAALVEQARPDVFTTSLANLAPGETVVVVIEYQERLTWKDGEFGLRFPLTLSTRHHPGTPSPEGAPAAIPQSPRTSNLEEGPATKLWVTLDAGFPLAGVSSSSHAIEIEDQGPTRRRLTLASEQVPANRDFRLSWRPTPSDAPRAAVCLELRQDQSYVLLLLQPPRDEVAEAERLPREVLLVIDSSGSMRGDRMEHARRAVLDALERLKPEDRVNLIDFDSQAQALWPTSRQVTPETRDQVKSFVRGIAADGGTNMLSALHLALGAAPVPGFLRQVIFVTDGQIQNDAQLFSAIHRKLGKSRLFTVGIGAAPNNFFMERAARLGRGTFTQIESAEKVPESMGRLFHKLENPVMRDLVVRWPSSTVEAWPEQIPDLYAGEPLVVVARLKDPGESVTISGGRGEKQFETSVPLPVESRPGVARLWAREKIAALSLRQSQDPDASRLEEELTAVALEHGLVSRYTSLVAVEKERSRPAGEPLESKKIPTLPAVDAAPPPPPHHSGPISSVPEPEEWALLLLALGFLTQLVLAEKKDSLEA